MAGQADHYYVSLVTPYIIITHFNIIISNSLHVLLPVTAVFLRISTSVITSLLPINSSIISYYYIVNTLLLRIITSVITSFPIIT